MTTDLYNIANGVARYSAELITDSAGVHNIYDSLQVDLPTQAFLRSQSAINVAGMGLITKQMYDIAFDGEEPSTEDRNEAMRVGGLTLLLCDIVDDVVDDSMVAVEDKHSYLDDVAGHMLEGQPYEHGDSVISSSIYQLTERIFGKLTEHDGIDRFASVMNPLIDDIKTQFVSRDLDKQLELIRNVGGYCGEIAAAAVEVVTGETFVETAGAASHLGAYAQCLDNAYEIREDIQEGSLSYATLFMEQKGNTARSHRQVRKILLDTARNEYESGTRLLSPTQRSIYKAAQTLLAGKYKVYGRIKSLFPASA